jgi:hypothetical protein
MLLVEWWLIRRISGALLMIAVAPLCFWIVREQRCAIRLPVQLVSSLIALCGALFLLFISVFPNPNSYSGPIYSPNRTMAARVFDYNASGFGGADTSVEIFTSRGFRSEVVFYGEFKSVAAENVRWRSDSELEITFERESRVCRSAFGVNVRCVIRHP